MIDPFCSIYYYHLLSFLIWFCSLTAGENVHQVVAFVTYKRFSAVRAQRYNLHGHGLFHGSILLFLAYYYYLNMSKMRGNVFIEYNNNKKGLVTIRYILFLVPQNRNPSHIRQQLSISTCAHRTSIRILCILWTEHKTQQVLNRFRPVWIFFQHLLYRIV